MLFETVGKTVLIRKAQHGRQFFDAQFAAAEQTACFFHPPLQPICLWSDLVLVTKESDEMFATEIILPGIFFKQQWFGKILLQHLPQFFLRRCAAAAAAGTQFFAAVGKFMKKQRCLFMTDLPILAHSEKFQKKMLQITCSMDHSSVGDIAAVHDAFHQKTIHHKKYFFPWVIAVGVIRVTAVLGKYENIIDSHIFSRPAIIFQITAAGSDVLNGTNFIIPPGICRGTKIGTAGRCGDQFKWFFIHMYQFTASPVDL